MLTSCWSRDISKRGLIKLPPCGRGRGEGGFRREGDRRGTTRQNLRDLGVRLDFIVPKLSPAWSQPEGSRSLLSWTLTNLFPTHSNYQDTSNRGERGEGRIWEEKVYRWQLMGENCGAGLGRWRYWKLLGECFFLSVDNYFVIERQV